MSTRHTYILFFSCTIALLMLFATGCATQKSFTAVSCPPDKALVYVYWEHQFIKGHNLTILINHNPTVILHSGGYYPLILDPGSVTLGYSVRLSVYPIFQEKKDELQLLVESGKTYYVAYEPWSGSWSPKLTVIDTATAEPKIKNYTLSSELK